MNNPNQELLETDVVSVFATLKNPFVPLTAAEIRTKLDEEYPQLEQCLDELVEKNVLSCKRIEDGPRVWLPTLSAGTSLSGTDKTDTQLSPPTFESNSLAGRIFDAAPISVMVVDDTGTIKFANDRAEKTLTLKRTEETAQPYLSPQVELYDEDGTPIADENHPVTRVLKTGEAHFGEEYWLKRHDGRERWVLCNAAPVFDTEGNVEYVVLGFEDTTAMKQREEKLTSDQWRVLELYSEELFEPFEQATDGSYQITIDEMTPCCDETTLQYITAANIPPKQLIDACRRCCPTQSVRLLSTEDNQCRIELKVTSSSIGQTFEDVGGTVRSLGKDDPTSVPTLLAELPGNIEPRTVLEQIREHYPDIELKAQELRYTPRLLYHAVEDTMTDRKLSILQTAYHAGYFETPRTSTGNELADQLNITRQTFNQHLRKAQQAVFEQLFEASGGDAR